MMTREGLARFSSTLESELVLSVYIARESQDPGMGEAWRRRLLAAIGNVRSDIESEAPLDLPAFDRAAAGVASALEAFGRILPQQGWCVFATERSVSYSEGLPFQPQEMVKWRMGPYMAPFVRSFKSSRPVILGLMDRWNAHLFRFQDDDLSPVIELEADRSLEDASDVGVAKRASGTSGMRGMTGADFAQRSQAEEARRLRSQIVEAIEGLCGDDGGVVLGGTKESITAVRADLDEKLAGRIAELPELSFDTGKAELLSRLRDATSRLTADRQAGLIESSADPRRGSQGWNETYRALAAGAVDTLLIARGMIATAPDDAERLVRLALTQGAEVEEVGGDIGDRLVAETDGVAARLRFLPGSLKA